jgi:hypothetical protein
VFLNPYVIEFDDLDAAGELRFNAIGLVDGRMLFVTSPAVIHGRAVRAQRRKAAACADNTTTESGNLKVRSVCSGRTWRTFEFSLRRPLSLRRKTTSLMDRLLVPRFPVPFLLDQPQERLWKRCQEPFWSEN